MPSEFSSQKAKTYHVIQQIIAQYRPEDVDKNIEIVQRHLKVSEVVKMFDELDSFQASQQHLEKSAQRLAKKELQQ